jgi:WD40 repeat protein
MQFVAGNVAISAGDLPPARLRAAETCDRDNAAGMTLGVQSDEQARVGSAEALGRFELRGLLGEGAFGTVYRAYDPLLDRDVALKIPKFSSRQTRFAERFQREARAAARLRHPNIVAVFEGGAAQGQPYIASEYIEGLPLSDRIAAGPPEFRQSAAWVRELAQALDYAHGEGIIHRDVKPANILLNAANRPQLMDFGLAKLVGDEDAGLTADGSIVGTPAYMSPEQARGELEAVGPLSDQYSLGVVLYELLTGRKPFLGPPHTVIAQVAAEEPPAPRSFDARIPQDLEAICLRAMEKSPDRRYGDLSAMADDLERWLSGRETRARPIGLWERGLRWRRREPAIARLTAVVVLVALTGFCAVAWQWRRAEANHLHSLANFEDAQEQRLAAEKNLDEVRRQRQIAENNLSEAERQRQRAEAAQHSLAVALEESQTHLAEANRQRERAEVNLAEAVRQSRLASQSEDLANQEKQAKQKLLGQEYLARGLSLCKQGQAGAGVLWLARGLEILPPEKAELANTIRAELALQEGKFRRLRLAMTHSGPVRAAALDSSGQLLVTAGDDKALHLWNATTGAVIGKIPQESRVTALALSPDGGLILAGTEGRTAQLWETQTLKAVGRPMPHDDEVTAVAVGPGGKTAATGSLDRFARIWNLETHKVSGRPLEHSGPVLDLALSSDGQTLLTGSGGILGGQARLWQVRGGKLLRAFPQQDAPVRAVALSPDGQKMVTGGDDKLVRIWELKSGAHTTWPSKHIGPILAVAFSSDSRTVITGSADGTARLWNVATGEPIDQPLQHPGAVFVAGFSAGSSTILTASADGTARLWTIADEDLVGRPLDDGSRVQAIAFSPDSRILLTGGDNKLVHKWDIPSGKLLGPPWPQTGPVSALVYNHHGTAILIAAQHEALARLCDATTGDRSGRRLVHSQPVTAMAFSPDDRYAATGSEDGAVRIWDAITGKPLGEPPAHRLAVRAVAFSPDGRKLLTASSDRTVRIWNVPSGKPDGGSLVHPAAVVAIAWGADSETILTACEDGGARLWSAKTGTQRGPVLPHSGIVRAIAFSPDGQTVATAGDDRTARLWRAASGEPIADPLRHPGAVTRIAFSPDGRTLLTAGADQAVRLWDSVTGQPIGSPLEQRAAVRLAEFSPDGLTIVVVAGTETRLWKMPAPVAGNAQHVTRWAQVLTGLELDANDQVRVLDLQTWQQRQRRLEEEGPPAIAK